MTQLGYRIKKLRQERQLTQKQVAELTGLKQNTISNHENGHRLLDEKDLETYAQAFNIDLTALFDDHPYSYSNQVYELDCKLEPDKHASWISYGRELLDEQESAKKPLIEYRVYERLSAGSGSSYYEDYSYDSVYYDEDISHDLASWIYGDSMEPAYLNGEVALIKESGFDLDGAVYAVSWAGQTYIKRVYLEEDGFRLVSLNPKYAPLFAHKDEDPRIVGKVVGHFMPLEIY